MNSFIEEENYISIGQSKQEKINSILSCGASDSYIEARLYSMGSLSMSTIKIMMDEYKLNNSCKSKLL